MWIVRLALRRPYTFVVLSILLLIMGPVTILRTPTDIFPNINIPVVSIVWQYAGLSADQMAGRIVTITERTLSTTVNNIEHVESQSLNGTAVVKIFFQPHVDISTAIAQVTAVSQTQLRQLPQGTTPPLIIAYNASSVPILQLALSGRGLSEQELNDLGQNFLRPQLITVEGTAIPYSYGGKQRQVRGYLDTRYRKRNSGTAAAGCCDAARVTAHYSHWGSIHLCAGFHQRCGAGGDHCCLFDRNHDPDLPRQLAEHDHYRGFNPFIDSVLDHYAECAGRDDQHYDAGWAGAGGRHPCR